MIKRLRFWLWAATVLVLNGLVSARRWLRFWLWDRPLARLRREYLYVDWNRGVDDARGTREDPLRTLAELNRRTQGRVLKGDLVIELDGDFSDEDLKLSLTTTRGSVLVVKGGKPVARRMYIKNVKRFTRKFWKDKNLRARDWPEPPAAVNGVRLEATVERARFEALWFGKKQ
jgi:hypothetical protein